MTNYANGVYAERLAMRDLRTAGYEVMRSAGSHGVVDVVAWNGETVRFVQVKKDDYVSRDEREDLQALIVPANASVEIWRRVGSGNARYWRKTIWNGAQWTGDIGGPLALEAVA